MATFHTDVLPEDEKIPKFFLALTLAVLAVALPSSISDAYNAQFLYYYSATNYILAKLLIWLVLPTILIFLFQIMLSRHSNLFWIAITFLLSGLLLYINDSLIGALSFAAIITSAWFFSASLLARGAPVFCMAYFILLIYIAFAYFRADTLDGNALLNANPPSAPKIAATEISNKTKESLYVFVFDELSLDALRYALQNKPDSLPNFARFVSQSSAPSRSSTHFDRTEYVIPTMLSGQFANPDWSSEKNYSGENIFDQLHHKKLFVWGPEPYCQSLRRKNIPAHCMDDIDRREREFTLRHVLAFDLRRIFQIYLFNLPNTIFATIVESLPHEMRKRVLAIHAGNATRLDPAINVILERSISYDLDRLADFVTSAGEPNAFYFFHSTLPHYPYIGNSRLEVSTDFSNTAFHQAATIEAMTKVYLRYQENIQAADTLLGKMLTVVDERDPNAIVIVTSDHGAAFNLDANRRRPTGQFSTCIAEIPFLLRLPAGHPYFGRPMNEYQHIDFFPTVLELLGIKAQYSGSGVSVFGNQRSPFYYRSLDFELKTRPSIQLGSDCFRPRVATAK